MKRADIRVGGMYEMSPQPRPGRGKYRRCQVEVLRVEGEDFVVAARTGCPYERRREPKEGQEFAVKPRSLLRPWEDAEREQQMQEDLAAAHETRYREDWTRSRDLADALTAALGSRCVARD